MRQTTPHEYETAELSPALIERMAGKNWLTLLLHGPTGTGKTHQLWGLFNRHGPTKVRMISEAVDIDRRRYDWDIIDYLARRECVLCIDDIGYIRTPSTWAQQALYAILNHRLANGLQTIITSNLSHPELLEAYGPAIMSRVLSGAVFACGGNDRRKDKTWTKAE